MRIPSKSELRYYRSCYPVGTRIQLDKDMDDPQPVLAGTKGTVVCVDDIANIQVKWDNGRSLAIIPDVDSFHKLQLENNENLIGHAVDGNRNLRSIQDVAGFIIQHGKYGDVEITTECGEPFIKTCGTYIDTITDMEHLDKLLEILVPMQHEMETAEEMDSGMSQVQGGYHES